MRIFKYFFFFQGGVLLFLLSIFFLKGCLLGLILRHCLSFLSSFFVGKGGSSAIFVFFVREVFFSFLGGYHLLDFFYHFLFIFFYFLGRSFCVFCFFFFWWLLFFFNGELSFSFWDVVYTPTNFGESQHFFFSFLNAVW